VKGLHSPNKVLTKHIIAFFGRRHLHGWAGFEVHRPGEMGCSIVSPILPPDKYWGTMEHSPGAL